MKGLNIDSPLGLNEGSVFNRNVILDQSKVYINDLGTESIYSETSNDYEIIGLYATPDKIYIVSTNNIKTKIVVFENESYIIVIETAYLSFTKVHPIKTFVHEYTYEGYEYIIFSDGVNPPIYLCPDKLPFELDGTKEIITTKPNLHQLLYLNPFYKSAIVKSINVVSGGGDLPVGVYNIAIQYKITFGNYTPTTEFSNNIFCYPNNIITNFFNVDAVLFSNLNYSINLVLDSVDEKFSQFRFVLQYTNKDQNIFYHTADYSITELKEYTLNSISNWTIKDRESVAIYEPSPIKIQALKMFENNLLLGNVSYIEIPKMQCYANAIKVDQVIKFGDITNIHEHAFSSRCFKPNEVYALGLVLHFINGQKSQVYHIPGRAYNETLDLIAFNSDDGSSFIQQIYDFEIKSWHTHGTGFWQNESELYPDNENSDIFDSTGAINGTLRNLNVRHHKTYSIEKALELIPQFSYDSRIYFEVSNVNIPQEYRSLVSHYEIVVDNKNITAYNTVIGSAPIYQVVTDGTKYINVFDLELANNRPTTPTSFLRKRALYVLNQLSLTNPTRTGYTTGGFYVDDVYYDYVPVEKYEYRLPGQSQYEDTYGKTATLLLTTAYLPTVNTTLALRTTLTVFDLVYLKPNMFDPLSSIEYVTTGSYGFLTNSVTTVYGLYYGEKKTLINFNDYTIFSFNGLSGGVENTLYRIYSPGTDANFTNRIKPLNLFTNYVKNPVSLITNEFFISSTESYDEGNPVVKGEIVASTVLLEYYSETLSCQHLIPINYEISIYNKMGYFNDFGFTAKNYKVKAFVPFIFETIQYDYTHRLLKSDAIDSTSFLEGFRNYKTLQFKELNKTSGAITAISELNKKVLIYTENDLIVADLNSVLKSGTEEVSLANISLFDRDPEPLEAKLGCSDPFTIVQFTAVYATQWENKITRSIAWFNRKTYSVYAIIDNYILVLTDLGIKEWFKKRIKPAAKISSSNILQGFSMGFDFLSNRLMFSMRNNTLNEQESVEVTTVFQYSTLIATLNNIVEGTTVKLQTVQENDLIYNYEFVFCDTLQSNVTGIKVLVSDGLLGIKNQLELLLNTYIQYYTISIVNNTLTVVSLRPGSFYDLKGSANNKYTITNGILDSSSGSGSGINNFDFTINIPTGSTAHFIVLAYPAAAPDKIQLYKKVNGVYVTMAISCMKSLNQDGVSSNYGYPKTGDFYTAAEVSYTKQGNVGSYTETSSGFYTTWCPCAPGQAAPPFHAGLSTIYFIGKDKKGDANVCESRTSKSYSTVPTRATELYAETGLTAGTFAIDAISPSGSYSPQALWIKDVVDGDEIRIKVSGAGPQTGWSIITSLITKLQSDVSYTYTPYSGQTIEVSKQEVTSRDEFSLSFSIDNREWASLHDYNSFCYSTFNGALVSVKPKDDVLKSKVYLHNNLDTRCFIQDSIRKSWVEKVVHAKGISAEILHAVGWISEVYEDDTKQQLQTVDGITFWNDFFCSGEQTILKDALLTTHLNTQKVTYRHKDNMWVCSIAVDNTVGDVGSALNKLTGNLVPEHLAAASIGLTTPTSLEITLYNNHKPFYRKNKFIHSNVVVRLVMNNTDGKTIKVLDIFPVFMTKIL